MDNSARTALRAMLSEHSALEVMRIILGELDLHPGELAQARSMADLALLPHYEKHRKRVECFIAANPKWYDLALPASSMVKSHAVSSLYSHQHGTPTDEGLPYRIGPMCGIAYSFLLQVPWDFRDSYLHVLRDEAIRDSPWSVFPSSSTPRCSICAGYLKNSQQGNS